MPISPQHVAPPIDDMKLQAVYDLIDRKLSNALEVSSMTVQADAEEFKPDFTSFLVPVPGFRLNVSEQDKMSKAYLSAGWKHCSVHNDGSEPGRGLFSTILLRSINQVMVK